MYAIIRTQKHKAIGAVARSARHTFREQPTQNASSSLSSENRVLGCRDTASLLRAIKAHLPSSRRRDAVICIEYLITASPEAFSRHGGPLDDLGSGYFRDALAWLHKRHGKENVVCAAVHLDETTPHLVAYAIPITNDGRLSARDFLGGPKVMREMQDSFHDACGKPRGLLRGVKGSKADHSEISKFYALLASKGATPELSARDYAAKAVGFETKAWREAQAVALTHSKNAALRSKQRKSTCAQLKALDQAESRSREYERQLSIRQAELDRRERSLKRREQELAIRQPELDIANARAEAAERLLELNQSHQKADVKRNTYTRVPRPPMAPFGL
ncbi:MobV family relaxase [Pseudomonas aeruginosa]|uniref:MobV family relaxase n=1 Tax=Pseudomonas aeruginosa TaxID=287 RepID=UPI003C6E6345